MALLITNNNNNQYLTCSCSSVSSLLVNKIINNRYIFTNATEQTHAQLKAHFAP